MAKMYGFASRAALPPHGLGWQIWLVVLASVLALGGCAANGGSRAAIVDDTAAKSLVEDQAGTALATSLDSDQADAAAKPKRAQGGGSYVVFGKRYTIFASSKGHIEKGLASWYGRKFHGRLTSNGERYNMYAMTAAHKSLPLPTFVEVTNLANGRSVRVKVNDRGPFIEGRVIDLSYAAAKALGMVKSGVAPVEVRAIDTEQPVGSAGQLLAATAGNAPDAPDEASLDPAPLTTAANDTQLVARAPGRTGQLYVPAGRFGQRNNAEELRKRLLGHLSQQVEIRVREDVLSRYEVQVGPLATPDEADQIAEQLVALGVSKPSTQTH